METIFRQLHFRNILSSGGTATDTRCVHRGSNIMYAYKMPQRKDRTDIPLFLLYYSAAQRISFLGTDNEEEVRQLYGSGFAMRLATERQMTHDMGGRTE